MSFLLPSFSNESPCIYFSKEAAAYAKRNNCPWILSFESHFYFCTWLAKQLEQSIADVRKVYTKDSHEFAILFHFQELPHMKNQPIKAADDSRNLDIAYFLPEKDKNTPKKYQVYYLSFSAKLALIYQLQKELETRNIVDTATGGMIPRSENKALEGNIHWQEFTRSRLPACVVFTLLDFGVYNLRKDEETGSGFWLQKIVEQTHKDNQLISSNLSLYIGKQREFMLQMIDTTRPLALIQRMNDEFPNTAKELNSSRITEVTRILIDNLSQVVSCSYHYLMEKSFRELALFPQAQNFLYRYTFETILRYIKEMCESTTSVNTTPPLLSMQQNLKHTLDSQRRKFPLLFEGISHQWPPVFDHFEIIAKAFACFLFVLPFEAIGDIFHFKEYFQEIDVNKVFKRLQPEKKAATTVPPLIQSFLGSVPLGIEEEKIFQSIHNLVEVYNMLFRVNILQIPRNTLFFPLASTCVVNLNKDQIQSHGSSQHLLADCKQMATAFMVHASPDSGKQMAQFSKRFPFSVCLLVPHTTIRGGFSPLTNLASLCLTQTNIPIHENPEEDNSDIRERVVFSLCDDLCVESTNCAVVCLTSITRCWFLAIHSLLLFLSSPYPTQMEAIFPCPVTHLYRFSPLLNELLQLPWRAQDDPRGFQFGLVIMRLAEFVRQKKIIVDDEKKMFQSIVFESFDLDTIQEEMIRQEQDKTNRSKKLPSNKETAEERKKLIGWHEFFLEDEEEDEKDEEEEEEENENSFSKGKKGRKKTPFTRLAWDDPLDNCLSSWWHSFQTIWGVFLFWTHRCARDLNEPQLIEQLFGMYPRLVTHILLHNYWVSMKGTDVQQIGQWLQDIEKIETMHSHWDNSKKPASSHPAPGNKTFVSTWKAIRELAQLSPSFCQIKASEFWQLLDDIPPVLRKTRITNNERQSKTGAHQEMFLNGPNALRVFSLFFSAYCNLSLAHERIEEEEKNKHEQDVVPQEKKGKKKSTTSSIEREKKAFAEIRGIILQCIFLFAEKCKRETSIPPFASLSSSSIASLNEKKHKNVSSTSTVHSKSGQKRKASIDITTLPLAEGKNKEEKKEEKTETTQTNNSSSGERFSNPFLGMISEYPSQVAIKKTLPPLWKQKIDSIAKGKINQQAVNERYIDLVQTKRFSLQDHAKKNCLDLFFSSIEALIRNESSVSSWILEKWCRIRNEAGDTPNTLPRQEVEHSILMAHNADDDDFFYFPDCLIYPRDRPRSWIASPSMGQRILDHTYALNLHRPYQDHVKTVVYSGVSRKTRFAHFDEQKKKTFAPPDTPKPKRSKADPVVADEFQPIEDFDDLERVINKSF